MLNGLYVGMAKNDKDQQVIGVLAVFGGQQVSIGVTPAYGRIVAAQLVSFADHLDALAKANPAPEQEGGG